MQETNNLPEIYLCDIDGTLSCHKGIRSPYDEGRVREDNTLPTCAVIKSLIRSGNKIIFFSGRTEGCRFDSLRWLEENISNEIQTEDLFMRTKGDNRNDAIIKEELYNTHIKNKCQVLGVFDDRMRVCRMWYDLGIFVFNCNQGLIEF